MLLAPCPGVRVWKGDRARSLYRHSQRPATLCRQPRAYPEPFALVGPAAPDPRELFLGGMKEIGGSGSSAGGHDTKCDKYFLCKSRGTVTTRNRPVPGRRRRRAKSSPWTDTAIPYDVDFGLSRCMPTANENRPVHRRAQFRRARFSRKCNWN